MADDHRNDEVVGEPRLSVEVLAVNAETAAKMVGISRRTWSRLRSEGLLPPPVQIGSCSKPVWLISVLKKWAESGLQTPWKEGLR